jgi:hypothetical protein
MDYIFEFNGGLGDFGISNDGQLFMSGQRVDGETYDGYSLQDFGLQCFGRMADGLFGAKIRQFQLGTRRLRFIYWNGQRFWDVPRREKR